MISRRVVVLSLTLLILGAANFVLAQDQNDETADSWQSEETGAIQKTENDTIILSQDKEITTKSGKTHNINTDATLVKDEDGYHWVKNVDINNPQNNTQSSSNGKSMGWTTEGSGNVEKTDDGFQWSSATQTQTNRGKTLNTTTSGNATRNNEGGYDWQSQKDISTGSGGGANIVKTGSSQKDESGNINWDSQAKGNLKDSDKGWTTDKSGQAIKTDNGALWSSSAQLETTGGREASSVKSGTLTKSDDGYDWQSSQNIVSGKGGANVQTDGSIVRNEDGSIDFSKEKEITMKNGKTITVDTEGTLVKDEKGYHWEKDTNIDIERPQNNPENKPQTGVNNRQVTQPNIEPANNINKASTSSNTISKNDKQQPKDLNLSGKNNGKDLTPVAVNKNKQDYLDRANKNEKANTSAVGRNQTIQKTRNNAGVLNDNRRWNSDRKQNMRSNASEVKTWKKKQ